ncbi:MAG: pilus assembly protein TadG-related protein, partial [Gaiellales bacterium]
MKRIAATLTKRARRAAAPRERGAVLVFVAALLLAMMVFTAFAVDLGRAYFAQRHLQSAADAAALAGAQELPNGGAAAAVAAQYDGTSGGKNEHSNISVTSTSVST